MNGTDNERVTGVVILTVMAGAILPTLIPSIGAAVSTWLLDHQVLVDPDQAAVVIPGLHAGLDTRRLIIAFLLMVAAVTFAAAARRGSGPTR